MKLREVTIRNFRCLKDVTLPIDDLTVLIGENNCGKTALLEALRIALPRTFTERPALFGDYDYHMCKEGDTPQTSEGIMIELWFREDKPDEWPEPLTQALTEVIQTDPSTDLDSIGLRLSSKYDAATAQAIPKWEFLALTGEPLGGAAARPMTLNRFLPYVRVFYLTALRDPEDEFSARSQFWGRILRDLKIGEEQQKAIVDELKRLNGELLAADPRLQSVAESLNEAQNVLQIAAGQKTSIQALPVTPWDLMSKAQVVMRATGNEVDFPLARHGQGMQSLAILFLLEAYINVLLKPLFHEETEAILALEEPEAHLHPQAIRALAANVEGMGGQKIVSSHSPYFIQEIPFEKLRMLRRAGPLSEVVYIKRSFRAKVPYKAGLEAFCKGKGSKFSFQAGTSTFLMNGKMEEREYRSLLSMYSEDAATQAEIKRVCDESQLYLSDEDLTSLDTFAKRIRGEMLFARAWLLCEGPCEYLGLRYFAELMGKPLDRAGVSVIDFQNNGSPRAFVGLARAFDVPWVLICDNDKQKEGFVAQVKSCGVSDGECNRLVYALPGEGTTLERFLVRNGFAQEYAVILAKRGVHCEKRFDEPGFEDEVVPIIERHKTEYMRALLAILKENGAGLSRVPRVMGDVIQLSITKAQG